MAAHESSNSPSFAPVAISSAPDGGGQGVIGYVKGTSGEEPTTEWTSSFRFFDLTPGTACTVTVKGRFAIATASSAICSFTTTSSGDGGCSTRFTGLQRLAVSQLVTGDTAAGVPVAPGHPTGGTHRAGIDHQPRGAAASRSTRAAPALLRAGTDARGWPGARLKPATFSWSVFPTEPAWPCPVGPAGLALGGGPCHVGRQARAWAPSRRWSR